MGNSHSNDAAIVHWKLSHVLPMGPESVSKNKNLYIDNKDREQFVASLQILLTSNGALDLKDYNFRLLYTCRPGPPHSSPSKPPPSTTFFSKEEEYTVARIIAEKDGVIRAKVEGAEGKDQVEAFRALRKWVDVGVDRILEGVPQGGTVGTAPLIGGVGAGGGVIGAGMMGVGGGRAGTPESTVSSVAESVGLASTLGGMGIDAREEGNGPPPAYGNDGIGKRL